jgi:hypothetical protein
LKTYYSKCDKHLYIRSITCYIHLTNFLWHLKDLRTYFVKVAPHKSSPLIRTSRYRRFVLCSILGHVRGGNSCGGYTLMGVAMTHAG